MYVEDFRRIYRLSPVQFAARYSARCSCDDWVVMQRPEGDDCAVVVERGTVLPAPNGIPWVPWEIGDHDMATGRYVLRGVFGGEGFDGIRILYPDIRNVKDETR